MQEPSNSSTKELNDFWSYFTNKIKQEITPTSYSTWVESAKPLYISGNDIHISVATKLHQEYWTLGLSEDDADKIIEKYKALSHLQDEELISICSNSPSSVQCTQLIKESLDFAMQFCDSYLIAR